MPFSARRLPPTCWWVVCALVMLVPSAHAQRRDVVVMNNGDRLTGKIKKLEHGQLFMESDLPGRLPDLNR